MAPSAPEESTPPIAHVAFVDNGDASENGSLLEKDSLMTSNLNAPPIEVDNTGDGGNTADEKHTDEKHTDLRNGGMDEDSDGHMKMVDGEGQKVVLVEAAKLTSALKTGQTCPGAVQPFKRRVQWVDDHGGDIAHVKEFEPSESGDSDEEEHEGDSSQSCSCVIQ